MSQTTTPSAVLDTYRALHPKSEALYARVCDQVAARHDGAVVRLYHLLWELTHVCFEHGGFESASAGGECGDDVCITCSDEGRPGEVLAVDPQGMASVRTASGVEVVDATLVSPVDPGALVLIHAGTAIAVVPE